MAKSERKHLHAVKPAEAPPAAEGLTGAAAPAAPTKAATPVDTEVVPGPRRRAFTSEFKRQVLAEADACTAVGEVGALLRKHGLYSSHLTEWRRQRDEGLRPKKRGRKVNEQRALSEEVAKLKREKARLEERLRQAEIIIGVQKKLSLLLGIPLPPVPTTTTSEDDE